MLSRLLVCMFGLFLCCCFDLDCVVTYIVLLTCLVCYFDDAFVFAGLGLFWFRLPGLLVLVFLFGFVP